MGESSDSIAAMCAAHGPVDSAGSFAEGTVFGDWRLTAFIGRGGSGEVYCAKHVALGTSAAVKVLVREEERAKVRFAHESKLLSELKSASFPRFYAFGEANGHAYLAMELLEPGDLPSGDKDVARFLLKVCDAVAELHALGLVHRDIKPGNILWRSPTEPVLADLGLVKAVGDSANATPNSQPLNSQLSTTHAAGTPGYGAPEQMERGEVSFAADVHALGVLADRCFGGNPPRAWARIVERATSSIPAHRYPSVAAFASAIRSRHWRRNALAGMACTILMIVAGSLLREPVEQIWNRWRGWMTAPVIDASAVLDGNIVQDVQWFFDDKPVKLPYRLDERERQMGGKPISLEAVVQKNGKTYSAKRMDVVPDRTRRQKLSLSLGIEPTAGTPIRIWAPDGTAFDFTWCPGGKAGAEVSDRCVGFWMATQRLTKRQFSAITNKKSIRYTSIVCTAKHDIKPDDPFPLDFNWHETVPVVAFPGSGLTLGPPDVAQKKCMERLAVEHGDGDEWVFVPPGTKGVYDERGGWMKMGGGGKGRFFAHFGAYRQSETGSAYVCYIAKSWFVNETNTVLYCSAKALLRSEAKEDVARGIEMMKGFIKSDDPELRMQAMVCCIERGALELEDFGADAPTRLRYAAIERGELNTLERLAMTDPDPNVRECAYEKLDSPSPMVSAQYIAKIRMNFGTADIGKPLKIIDALTDREALSVIAKEASIQALRDEAKRRLDEIAAKK